MAGEDQPSWLQWQQFEREVARVLADMDANAQVEYDAHILGGLSGVERQIDALIRGTIVGHSVTLVAECKRYTKPVGIGLVDELVGKMLDVGADAGLMYAFAGYSSGAHSRAAGARNPKVELRRLPEEQGIDYESFIHRVGISFGDCPNVNCILGDVDWTNWEDGDGSIVQAGLCSACGTIAVRCGECGDVTALDSGQERCDSCEAVYEVLTDRDGIFEGVRRVS